MRLVNSEPQISFEVLQRDDYQIRALIPELQPAVLDVGAHMGTFSLYAAELGAPHVLAVEPLPETYLQLRANLEANADLAQRIEARNVGVAYRAGQRSLAWKPGLLGESSFYRTLERTDEIECVTLESLIGAMPTTAPLLLKMDVEGAEHEAFIARNLGVVDFICAECHNFAGPLCEALLIARGFAVRLVTPAHIRPQKGHEFEPVVGLSMLFGVNLNGATSTRALELWGIS